MNTQEEFYTYIDSFNKKPGQYTPDELYKIGIEHKKLPLGQRDWKKLSAYVAYPGASDSYRQFIKRTQKKEGSLAIKENSLGTPEYESTFKENLKKREAINTYKKVLRQEANTDNFLNTLKEVAHALPEISLNTKKRCNRCSDLEGNSSTKEAVLMLSDMHIGVQCKNFYNEYDYDIAVDRVNKLVSNTINYCRAFNVRTLHVLNLGDLIQGYIHLTARISAQFNVVEQVVKAADIVSRMLVALKEAIPEVTYRSCTDNHARMTANFRENLEEENFNLLIDVIIEERLKDFPIKFIKDNLDPSIMYFKLNTGHTIMAAHGHLEKPDKVIDDFTGATGQLPDYVLLSHIHAARMKAYNGSHLYVNGSICGTEDYAISKRLFNHPEQMLLIFDQNNVVDVHINLK